MILQRYGYERSTIHDTELIIIGNLSETAANTAREKLLVMTKYSRWFIGL